MRFASLSLLLGIVAFAGDATAQPESLPAQSAPELPAESSGATPAPPASPPAQPSGRGASRNTVALIAAGVAVAAAGAGTAFGLLALQNKSDYDKGPTYTNADRGNDDAAYADGCFALAAAAGITSLVLFLTDAPHDDDHPAAKARPARVSAVPIVTSRGGGAGLVLQF